MYFEEHLLDPLIPSSAVLYPSCPGGVPGPVLGTGVFSTTGTKSRKPTHTPGVGLCSV